MAGKKTALQAAQERRDSGFDLGRYGRGKSLAFPVHPNPEVRRPTEAALAGAPRTLLLDPLGYRDFLHLLSCAWLVVSDSGGVQEEAPTLGMEWRQLAQALLDAGAAAIARLVSDAISDHDLWKPELIGVGGGAGALVPAVADRLALD